MTAYHVVTVDCHARAAPKVIPVHIGGRNIEYAQRKLAYLVGSIENHGGGIIADWRTLARIEEAVAPEAHHVSIVGLHLGDSHSVCLRLYKVVRVQEGHILARGMVQTRIAGGAESGVLLVYHLDPRVLCRISVAHRGTSVGRLVVDQNHLDIPEGLPQQRPHTAIQIALRLVDRHYHRQPRPMRMIVHTSYQRTTLPIYYLPPQPS